MQAVLVVANLFIAIVINSLEAATRDEHGPPDASARTLAVRLAGVRDELEAIESALRAAPRGPGGRQPE